MIKIIFSLICTFFAFIVFSCASDQGLRDVREVAKGTGEPVIPRKANKIQINAFKNGADYRILNEKLLIKVKHLIGLDSRLALAGENEDPELLLDCTINQFSIQPVEFNSMRVPVKKRMRITMKVTMKDLKARRIIFSDPNVYAQYSFSEYNPPIESEDAALDRLLSDLASRIYSKIETGWFTDRMTPMEKGK